MKFNSLKEFWEWLTISTGDVVTDYQAIKAYMDSGDATELLYFRQVLILGDYMAIIGKLANEQQELELK